MLALRAFATLFAFGISTRVLILRIALEIMITGTSVYHAKYFSCMGGRFLTSSGTRSERIS